MSQSGYELITKISEVAHAVIQVILFWVLWNLFYHGRQGKPYHSGIYHDRKTNVAILALLAVNIGICLLPYDVPGNRLEISALLILLYSVVEEKGHCEKTVFILTLFYGFHSLSYLVSNSVYQVIVRVILREIQLGNETYVENMYLYMSYNLVLYALLYLLLFLFMEFILWKKAMLVEKMNWHDVCFLSVLNVVGGLLAWIAVRLGDVEFDVFGVRKEMLWALPMIAALLYLGELSAITIYQKNSRLQQEKERIFTEQQQIKTMKRRLEEAENFYGSIRKVRHEMKSHMTNIKGLVAGEQYTELASYIEKMDLA